MLPNLPDLKKFIGSSLFVILIFAFIKLILHLVFANGYGYFIDELYTIACGEHLSFGYVDIPPLVPFLSRLSGIVFGYSLFGIHILPAVSGSLFILFTGLFTRELGGGRIAVAFACLAALLDITWLIDGSMFAYDNFDLLFTLIFLFTLLRLIKTGNTKMFILIGFIAGICIMTKFTLLFMAIALVPSLLLTSRRKLFASGWLWAGILIAAIMTVPYLLWQYSHGWPYLEYLANYSKSGTYHASVFEYLGMTVIFVNFALGIWVMGFIYFFRDPGGKKYMLFGFLPAFLFLVLFVIFKAKYYMIMVSYVPLLAGGSIMLEKYVTKPFWIGVNAFILLLGLFFIPIALPVLTPPQLEAFYSGIGSIRGGIKLDNSKSSVFPQWTADRFGWEQSVQAIAGVYNSLPEEDRAKCAIFCSNYGDAGAVDLLGGKYGLPKSISGILSYYIWGPGNNTAEIAIVKGVPKEKLDLLYSSVTEAAPYYNKYAMPYRNVPIYLCRGLKKPIGEIWKYFKYYR